MDNIEILRLKLEKILDDELKNLELARTEYEKLSRGELYISKLNNKYYFTEYTDGVRRGITKRPGRIYELARRKYLENMLKNNKKVCEDIRSLIDNNCDEAASDNKKILEIFHMLDGLRITCTADKFKWNEDEYRSNTYKPEHLKYSTGRGVKMRSKSERTIGNKLEEWDIAYRYENMFISAGEIYYPDFTIRKEDGTLVIWEHFGLMDNKEYYKNALSKINQYRKSGIKQYKNLICTYEDDLEDMRNLNEIIFRFLIN